MYDGSKRIFEKVKRLNEVTIIAVIGDKIIVQKQEQPHRDPFLSLPGGRCEEGEDPFEAAKREFLEETGYVSSNMILWKTIPSPYSTIIREAYYYIAKDCKQDQNINLDNGEKIKNELISFDDFIMLSEDPTFRDTDLTTVLLRLRLHPEHKEGFKSMLFQ